MKIIDIETVPQPGIMQTWFPEWAKKKMPNATAEELEQSAALHGEFGMVCAIGIADPGCSPSHVIAQDYESEKDALVSLDSVLLDNEALVGHNIKNFDIPFLAKRYLFHGLPVPRALRTAGKSRGNWFMWTQWNFCALPGIAQCRSAPLAFCWAWVTRRRLAVARKFLNFLSKGASKKLGVTLKAT